MACGAIRTVIATWNDSRPKLMVDVLRLTQQMIEVDGTLDVLQLTK
jgi:ATP/maltotriose-dependent transcriptional regulator MalT